MRGQRNILRGALMIICLLFITPVIAQVPVATQQIITGQVVEEGTGKPISNVSVFFDGTLNGISTDSTGNFTLYPQTTAKLPILVSGVGYDSKTITDYVSTQKLRIELKVRAYDLDAVTVLADDGMSRKEKLRIFRREFLGTSPSAKSCVILNEDDLRFTYSPKTHILNATCAKPLIIQNKSLGYTLNFLLTSFTYNGQQTAFYGSQFFRETAAPADLEKVKKARKTVYLGSQLHFVRAIWDNKLNQNGFEVIRYLKKDSVAAGRDRQYVDRDLRRLPYDSLVSSRDNQKFLRFSGLLKITYRTQISMMEGKDKPVVIESNGFIDPTGIVWTGNIGMQRAGDLLPLEFNVDLSPDQNQTNDVSSGLVVSTPLDTLHSRMPLEKLYIQLDKPNYSVGDTLRMKAYLLDAAKGNGSDNSGILYVELANDSNQVFFRRMLAMGYGLGSGNIVLNKKDIPEGSYTLRAYTNLMRNFGEEFSFQKNLYINSGTSQNWLVNSTAALSKRAEKDNVQLSLQFSELNKQLVKMKDLDIRILDGDRLIQRGKVQTDIDGKLNVNFNLPPNVSTRNISMTATDPKSPTHNVTIPITVSRPESVDLQFMPEGGNLVTGISSRVGFKAIGEDGNGIDVSGKIYNSTNEEVASFTSSYKGMGSFEFKPVGVTAYTARVMLNGTPKTFLFPMVKNTGAVLRMANTFESDSLVATITVSSNLAKASTSFYHLIGQSGGKVFYEEDIPVNGNTNVRQSIAKDLFPTGIVRFTLLSSDKQPLNERIVFIDNHDNLRITLKAAKPTYKTRDSVNVAIEVKDNEGRPVEGSFSLAVTDDSQVNLDTLGSNILTSMLLTSGLKGNIERPVHYLGASAQAAADLDNLLLTQGWVGYDWKDVFNPPATAAYPAEAEFVMKGKISNALNKGSALASIQLLSMRPEVVKTGTADNNGLFSFSELPVAEDLKYFLEARNKTGKRFNVGIEVDEFKPIEFKPATKHFLPWYVNADTVLLRQGITRAIQDKSLVVRGNLLQEVNIVEKKAVRDSKNLNGAGLADQILDERDLAKTPKKTLLDLMQAQVKGFNIGNWPSKNATAVGIESEFGRGSNSTLNRAPSATHTDPGNATNSKVMANSVALLFNPVSSYRIFDKELHLVIDGVDVESLYIPTPGLPLPVTDPQLIVQATINPNGDYILERNTASPTDRFSFIQQYLTRLTAEDVKGIEVMSNPQFNNKYKSKYASKILGSLSPISADFAYVEVTTHSGNGIYSVTPPGVYVAKPLSYLNNTSFYKPKYTTKPNPLADLRSTIHWEPDILTNKDGKATISFYSSDRKGTYSIVMEGSNMNGNVGRKIGSVKVQ